MKAFITIIGFIIITLSAHAQENLKTDDPTLIQVAEVSCGKCNFGMTDKKECTLAVKINGKAYWVDGADIENFGDADSEGGLCTTIRKAEIAGEIVEGKFKATHIKLLPMEKPGN